MDDLISRESAIDALHEYFADGFSEDRWWNSTHVLTAIKNVPSAEPQIIRCKDCRYYKQFGKSEWGDCLALSRICKSIDFCSWGARMETEQMLSEADNDTAYGGLMSAT